MRMTVEKLLQALPQGDVIKPHHAEKWLNAMQKREDFHNINWHINRLKGIGGSESISAVQRYALERGESLPDPFASPRYTAMQKLLMVVPNEANAKMLRGNRFESLIVDRFCEQMNAKKRDDLMEAVAEASREGVDRDNPWLIGNPDLIAEINGKVYLIDIKAPDEAHDEFPFGYQVQLHHYRLIMEKAGVAPDGMILANFSWKDYAILPLEVEYNRSIEKRILEGGKLLWDDILAGYPPNQPSFEDKKCPVDKETMGAFRELEEEYLLTKEVFELVKEKLEEKKRALVELATPWASEISKSHGLAKGLDLLTLNVRTKVNDEKAKALIQKYDELKKLKDDILVNSKEYDIKAMVKAMEEAGLSPEKYRKKKIDAKKMIEAAENADIPKSVLQESGVVDFMISPVFRKPSRGPRAENYAELLKKATPLTDTVANMLQKMNADIELINPEEFFASIDNIHEKASGKDLHDSTVKQSREASLEEKFNISF